jgi:hypothetical protein
MDESPTRDRTTTTAAEQPDTNPRRVRQRLDDDDLAAKPGTGTDAEKNPNVQNAENAENDNVAPNELFNQEGKDGEDNMVEDQHPHLNQVQSFGAQDTMDDEDKADADNLESLKKMFTSTSGNSHLATTCSHTQ